MIDPYRILGLERNATNEQIKQAYRKLAAKYHPDKPDGNEDLFKQIGEAYSQLTNPTSSGRTHHAYQQYEEFFNDFLNNNDFSDMFNNRYGWTNSGKGQDIHSSINLTLEEAYFGITKQIRVGLKTISIDIKPGVLPGQNLKLKGLGQKGISEDLNGDLILTILILEKPGYAINNRGLHIIHEIDAIDAIIGTKSIIEIFDKKISFNVPQFTNSGSILRIHGKGYPVYGRLGSFGDLYINIVIRVPKDLTNDETAQLTSIKTKIDERRSNL